MKKGIVHIVHHIDTEGPLYEPIEEVFIRLQNTIGLEINLSPTSENLQRLQRGQIDFPFDIKNEIKKIISPDLISFKETWNEIDEMLRRITSYEYRKKLRDSISNPWVYNWHIMDHVGFVTNERRRDIGYLNIFNHYERLFNELPKYNDEIQWHFHPISFKKEAHKCATSYENSYYELHQILCRRLIEKNWFPQVNRAGFHTIRPDSNWFLEQWIPFDASNQSIDDTSDTKLQTDTIGGRFGDWEGAPNDWEIYQPDLYDWRQKGNLNRYIARTLNLNTRFRNINETEIEKAFESASQGNKIYLGITNHDFREISNEIEDFYNLLCRVAKRYARIKFIHTPTTKAFQSVIGYNKQEIFDNRVDFKITIDNNCIKINFLNGEPFGPQPYLALKTTSGQYYHDNFDFGTFKKNYSYTLDNQTLSIKEIDKIGVATNDRYGNSRVKVISL